MQATLLVLPTGATVPTGHLVHVALPALSANEPPAHGWHEVPSSDGDWPVAHVMQAARLVLPTGATVPAGHLVHVALPASDVNEPPAHGTQVLRSAEGD